jgi:hypothetical protein
MLEEKSLEDLGQKVRVWAKSNRLWFAFTPAVNEEIERTGISHTQIRNVLRTGAATDLRVDEVQFDGRLDDGTPVSLQVEIDEVHDGLVNSKQQRVIVRGIKWPLGRRSAIQPGRKKLEVVRKRKNTRSGL